MASVVYDELCDERFCVECEVSLRMPLNLWVYHLGRHDYNRMLGK